MTESPSTRSDAADRELARTTFDRPVVLEAGAGTGKTAVLVSRVVTWALRDGFDKAAASLPGSTPAETARRVWQRTIAITFTEAAAAEMDERVRLALHGMREGRLPVGIPEAAGLLDAPDAPARIAALLDQIEHLAVSTIHSFCNSLLQAHPVEAGIHPDFRLDAAGGEVEELAREEVHRFVKRAFQGDGDPDAVDLMGRGYGPMRIQQDLLDLLEAGADPSWILDDPYPLARMRLQCEDFSSAVRTISAALEPLRDLRNKDGSPKKMGNSSLPGIAAACGELAACDPASGPAAFKTAAEAFDDSVIAKLKDWTKGKFTKTEDALFPDRQIVAQISEQFLSHIARFRSYDFEMLPKAARVVSGLLRSVRDRCREAGVLTFHDLLRLARDLLADRPEVLRRCQQDIDQLLVDEFQDTDPLQYDIVQMLALTGESRPGLFLVGDPKQSIYGWRRADLRAYHEFKNGLPGDSVVASLFVNFRSLPQVLHEVERVIAPVMVESAGLQPPFEALEPSERNRADPGLHWGPRNSVEVWRGAPGDNAALSREGEAAAIAADIAALARDHGVPWKATGILLRTKSSMPIYLRALESEGVPALVRGDRSFYQRREILDIANLARAALEPHDRISLLGWLRSPLVALPDAALPWLWRAGLPAALAGHRRAGEAARRDLERLLERARSSMPRDLPETAALPDYGELFIESALRLFELRRIWDEEPCDAFVRGLRDLFAPDISEALRFQGAIRVRAMERFYEQILSELTGGASDHDRLLRAIRRALDYGEDSEIDLLPDDENADCVRIMTVHNSKGLDFENVYLPDLQRTGKPRADRKARAEAPGDGPRFLLGGIPSCDFFEIEERERAVAEAESIRLLYVGMTRAKRRLVMSGNDGSRTFSRSWGLRHVLDGLPAAGETAASPAGAEVRTASHGIRVRLMAPPVPRRARRSSETFQPVDPGEIEALLSRFAGTSASARNRMEIPWATRATGDGHPGDLAGDGALEIHEIDLGEEREHLPASPPPSRDHAATLGTAAHAVFETLFRSGGGDAAISAAIAAAATRYGGEDPGPRLEEQLLSWIMPDGPAPLVKRFMELGDRLLGCEIPVSLAAEPSWPSSPVRTGRIDFLYRDGEAGEFVVADWKTEPLDDRSAEEAAGAHRDQAAIYCEAVRRAFGLPRRPRFELWYLRNNRIIELQQDGAAHPS